MIRAVRMLNLHRIAEQKLRAVLAVIAIAAGVAITVAVLIDQASVLQSADEMFDAQAGRATLKVQGAVTPGGLDPDVVDRVAAVDGVEAAVPLVSAITLAESGSGEEHYVIALGVDCRAEALVGPFGCSAIATPVLSQRLADLLGPDGVLRTNIGAIPAQGMLALPVLDAFNDGLVAILPLAQAQDVFSREGALDLVLVVPHDGVDPAALRHAVEQAAGPHNRVVAANAGPPITLIAGSFLAGLYLVALIGLGIGAQLVYSIVSLTLEERRRDSAIVAALGGSRRLLIVGALVEAGILGLLGGALGVAAGAALSRPLVTQATDLVGRLVGVHVGVVVPVWVIATGLGVGLGVSILAAVVPARRAARREVAAELHGAQALVDTATGRSARGTIVYGVVGLTGVVFTWVGKRGGALEPWQPIVGWIGLVLVLLASRGTSHAGPLLCRLLTRVELLQRGTPKVALDSLVSQPRRTGAMVFAVSAAVSMGVTIASMSAAIPETVAAHGLSPDRVLVSTLPTQNTGLIEAKLTPATEAALRGMPEVAEVHPVATVFLDHPSVGIVAVNATDRAYFDDKKYLGDDADAVLERGEVVIGPALARRKGLRPGDTVEVPGRDGFVQLRVGGISNNPDLAGNTLTVPLGRFEDIWRRHAPSFLTIILRPGIDATAFAAMLNGAPLESHLRALDADGLVTDITRESQVFVAPFAALQRALLFMALVATMSTLLLVGIQRRREHGVLTAVGMSPRDLGRTTLMEAALVGITGTVLGSIAAVILTVAVSWMFPVVAGPEMPLRFQFSGVLVYGGLATLAVVLGAALPAWRASRLDPVVALRYE